MSMWLLICINIYDMIFLLVKLLYIIRSLTRALHGIYSTLPSYRYLEFLDNFFVKDLDKFIWLIIYFTWLDK